MVYTTRGLTADDRRTAKRLLATVRDVNRIESDLLDLTDAELREHSADLEAAHRGGQSLERLLPEAFALVREAARRVLGQRLFDVQLMGGAALHLGNVAEMRTGEGKTLTCVLPAFLNALSGDGVHVVTANDYLAGRDAEWVGRVLVFLGRTVGVLRPEQSPAERRAAYDCDVTYGTTSEFGFDYLRDNMVQSPDDVVQRGLHLAIVDEADAVLIDEAVTPLIINGPAEPSTWPYAEFARLASGLVAGRHYEVDRTARTVVLTDTGWEAVEDRLGLDNLYTSEHTAQVAYLGNALQAKELYQRDREYVVSDGRVVMVDPLTGRMRPGRRFGRGLHQAIEALERVEVQHDTQPLATITLQHFFRLYERLAGLTGTAQADAPAEFRAVYGLGVVRVPTHRPVVRSDLPDVIHPTVKAKFTAVADEVAERHRQRQPVLVGTGGIDQSELMSQLLRKRGVPHDVLHAKHHAREAAIIAQAGRAGAVTVATNMAGRGTDIRLGGNPEFLAEAEARMRGLDPAEHPEHPGEYGYAFAEILDRTKATCADEAEAVTDAGGLCVLGTERQVSRRIDEQLRGRAGRQGDPGETRFHLSLEDELVRRDDGPAPLRFDEAQLRAEADRAALRRSVLEYDEVLHEQRELVYRQRRRVVRGSGLGDQIRHMIGDVAEAYVEDATAGRDPEDWDLGALSARIRELRGAPSSDDGSDDVAPARDARALAARLTGELVQAYDEREEEFGAEVVWEVERQVLLSVIDRRWREHLDDLEYLKEGIALRAYARRNPLVEYRQDAADLFAALVDGVKEETVGFLFKLEIEPPPPPEPVAPPPRPSLLRRLLQYTAPAPARDTPPAPHTGPPRNAPCPCGSGKKYKRCHAVLDRPGA